MSSKKNKRNKIGDLDSNLDLESSILQKLPLGITGLQQTVSNLAAEVDNIERRTEVVDNEAPTYSAGYIKNWSGLGGSNLTFYLNSKMHPMIFLNKLNTILREAGVPDECKKGLASASLKGKSADWGSIKEDSFTTYEDFQKAFKDRFWGVEKQREHSLELTYGRFESGIAFSFLRTTDYSKLPLWFPKMFLKSMFLWPGTEQSAVFIPLISVCAFANYGTINFIFRFGELLDNISYMAIIVGELQEMVKVFMIWFHSNMLKLIHDDIMNKFWPYDVLEGKDFQQIPKRLYKIVLVSGIVVFSAATIYGSIFLTSPIGNEERSLPLPVLFPFDWRITPAYELIYFIQVLSMAYVSFCSILGTNFLSLALCSCVTTQYETLCYMFSKFNTTEMYDINRRFRDLGEKVHPNYDEHKTYLQEPRDLFQSSIIILFIFGALSEPLTYCAIGNEMNYQAKILPDSIFFSNWTGSTSSLKNDIIIILARSQQAPELISYNLFRMDFDLFIRAGRLRELILVSSNW
ncbi:hypothetical protein JTB14_027728 [Gonioctena quinquepunctata]|nr:hypothetical protein JTB14_027728 [Gonioctena quinquepunctata]